MSREEELELMLARCRTILNNMAWENQAWPSRLFNRWPINHEPLRSDAKNILPEIDRLLNPLRSVA